MYVKTRRSNRNGCLERFKQATKVNINLDIFPLQPFWKTIRFRTEKLGNVFAGKSHVGIAAVDLEVGVAGSTRCSAEEKDLLQTLPAQLAHTHYGDISRVHH
jgi:hypothetical protein